MSLRPQDPRKKQQDDFPVAGSSPLVQQDTMTSQIVSLLSERSAKIVREALETEEEKIRKMREELERYRRTEQQRKRDQFLFLLLSDSAIEYSIKKFDSKRLANATIALVDVWWEHLKTEYRDANISREQAAIDVYTFLSNRAAKTQDPTLKKAYQFMANFALSYYLFGKKKKKAPFGLRRILPELFGIEVVTQKRKENDKAYQAFRDARDFLKFKMDQLKDIVTRVLEGSLDLFKPTGTPISTRPEQQPQEKEKQQQRKEKKKKEKKESKKKEEKKEKKVSVITEDMAKQVEELLKEEGLEKYLYT